MNGIELEALAWEEYEEWLDKYKGYFPGSILDPYELALVYTGDGIAPLREGDGCAHSWIATGPGKQCEICGEWEKG